MEEDEPGLRSLFEVDVALLTAEQLRVRMEDAQRAFTRQNARLAHLRASRKQALQVMEAESRLRASAEQSIEVLESELARLRARNTVLADQLHAREVQINRLGDLSAQATPRPHLASLGNDADDDDEEESDDASRKRLDFSKPTVANSDDGEDGDEIDEQTTFF
jgi:chromosome segregation ATPase